ncbi:sulfotransferase family protein [Corallococcus sp. AB049A]|uniref:Sulfotransferase family protein n=1 Tax=Corallococcus interemptor TaxID=2316720 RepID=A0A3A8QF65_9BACT|nr:MULTISPECIES: sulfotransferase [Corallococcus]RKH44050.1 sulfotransferase family protein [Corallococcus sp. AB050B]RKH67329.1 sulfotransferase family protein [Corallococcus interemptor]RKI62616.1 sulfotransferase family protein [Corallococcus sp. AB049A]
MASASAKGEGAQLTVLYITGWCRSGSTILGNVLNEVPGFFHVGELSFLWKNAYGNGSNTLCGCGQQLLECGIWNTVLTSGVPAGLTPRAHAEAVVRRQQAAVRTRHTLRVLDQAEDSQALQSHADFLARTYRTIARATGSTVLVDSGKFPSEAALLPHVEGIRPLYLHLVRDPRAVTHSWTKTKQYVVPMSAARSTAYWLGFNAASEEVTRRFPAQSLFLRYEDFIAAPDRAVDTVLDLVGVPRAQNPVKGRTVVLGKNHTVTGNPDRFRSGPTLLRGEDDAWKGELASGAKALTVALAWPLMAKYGYFSGARRAPIGGTAPDAAGGEPRP